LGYLILIKGFLQKQYFLILPLAVKWAEEGEQYILENGRSLNSDELIDARQAGVIYPEKIRICLVSDIPRPSKGILAKANEMFNFVTDSTLGLTLNYGIFVRNYFQDDRFLYFHEYVHVSQYERLGGVRGFLSQYLKECLEEGYLNSELENEAVTKTEDFKNKFSE